VYSGTSKNSRESGARYIKAAVCYKFDEPLVVEETEIDPPQMGKPKVKTAACAICRSDIHWIRGGSEVVKHPLWSGMRLRGVISVFDLA
jgi:D-arabinose 1-dehydrogenase-like Zn-dependent alcohol dehydrogenase